MDDYTITLLSQYANSPRMLALIDSFNSAVDPSQTIDDWYDLVWNVDTAQGFGLQVWGRIVNVNNIIQLPVSYSQQYFGFKEGGTTDYTGFNQEPFSAGKYGSVQSVQVSDHVFRNMILAKAFTNISDRSIPSINQALLLLFPNLGNSWVSDDGNMQCTYNFSVKLTKSQVAIIKQSGVVQPPTGVKFLVSDITGIR